MPATRIEIGTDAREIDGGPNERFAHAKPLRRVVIRVAGIVNEANRAICATVVIEFGNDDFSIRHIYFVLPDLFILDVVFVAGSNIEYEINVPGKNSCDIHYQFVGKSSGCGTFEKRSFYDTISESLAFLDRARYDFGAKT